MIKLLVVEDQVKIRDIIKTYARKDNITVDEAGSGQEAYEKLDEKDYDLIVLDVMLPDTDGWTILRKIRKEKQIPVIMLTARSEEEDKLLGFELGADDYVTKPFSSKELMARIKTVLKRNHTVTHGEIVEIDQLTINTSFHQVTLEGEILPLTPLEYDLLMYFVNHLNLALSREQILNGVWGYDYFGDERTVDTHVKRLRQKLGQAGKYIVTVRGLGYRLVVDPS